MERLPKSCNRSTRFRPSNNLTAKDAGVSVRLPGSDPGGRRSRFLGSPRDVAKGGLESGALRPVFGAPRFVHGRVIQIVPRKPSQIILGRESDRGRLPKMDKPVPVSNRPRLIRSTAGKGCIKEASCRSNTVDGAFSRWPRFGGLARFRDSPDGCADGRDRSPTLFQSKMVLPGPRRRQSLRCGHRRRCPNRLPPAVRVR